MGSRARATRFLWLRQFTCFTRSQETPTISVGESAHRYWIWSATSQLDHLPSLFVIGRAGPCVHLSVVDVSSYIKKLACYLTSFIIFKRSLLFNCIYGEPRDTTKG